MSHIDLGSVLVCLGGAVDEALDWQVTAAADPSHGGLVAPDSGVASATHGGASALLQAGGLLYLLADRSVGLPRRDRGELLERLTITAEYMLRAQRPSGLIDLPSANYDSSPDTAFVLQQLCSLLEVARLRPEGLAGDRGWGRLEGLIETFIRRAVPGVLTGGFHTPNHRWVIASALAQAGALYPELAVEPIVEAYLAEGVDIDAEGAYLERSAGIYDAVCNRSLLLLADQYGWEASWPAVRANLDLNLHLFHADGTSETGLSRRQDLGTRNVPLSLATTYLHAGLAHHVPLYVSAARWLWGQAARRGMGELAWLTYVMAKHGEPDVATVPLPDQYTSHYPLNQLYRVRQGPLSVSVFGGGTHLLSLQYGAAEIASVTINQTYFGVGEFRADSLNVEHDVVTLRSEGRRNPRRPAYEQPLGRPVPPERYVELLAERELRPIPPCTSSLSVRAVDGGLDLHYRTLDGLDKVSAQLALDMRPGGIWETESTSFAPRAGQTVFLKSGMATMRYGTDVICIGPGAGAHRTWEMRHSVPAPDHVRVLLTFFTPVDHPLRIRCRRGPG